MLFAIPPFMLNEWIHLAGIQLSPGQTLNEPCGIWAQCPCGAGVGVGVGL